jgi:hypothetical protein
MKLWCFSGVINVTCEGSALCGFTMFVKTFSVDGDHGLFLLLLELLQQSYIDITSSPKAGLVLHHKKSRHTQVIPLI